MIIFTIGYIYQAVIIVTCIIFFCNRRSFIIIINKRMGLRIYMRLPRNLIYTYITSFMSKRNSPFFFCYTTSPKSHRFFS